jgi:hypothetical protein
VASLGVRLRIPDILKRRRLALGETADSKFARFVIEEHAVAVLSWEKCLMLLLFVLAIVFGTWRRGLRGPIVLTCLVALLIGGLRINKLRDLANLGLADPPSSVTGQLTVMVLSFSQAFILCGLGYLIGLGCRGLWQWLRSRPSAINWEPSSSPKNAWRAAAAMIGAGVVGFGTLAALEPKPAAPVVSSDDFQKLLNREARVQREGPPRVIINGELQQ